jgi:hypothetical protein
VLRAEKQNEVPSSYIMKRWEKKCKRWVCTPAFFYDFVRAVWV